MGQVVYVCGVAKNFVAQFVFWRLFQKGEYVCGLFLIRFIRPRPSFGIFRDVNVGNAAFSFLNLRRPFFEKRVFFRKMPLFPKSAIFKWHFRGHRSQVEAPGLRPGYGVPLKGRFFWPFLRVKKGPFLILGGHHSVVAFLKIFIFLLRQAKGIYFSP